MPSSCASSSSTRVASCGEWKVTIPENSNASVKMVSTNDSANKASLLFRKMIAGPLAFKVWVSNIPARVWKLASDDPRRVFHSLKVGFALCLVSLFYFMNPLYASVGGMATWAVMTVVVIFEFTAGATLSKGVNRMTATLLGGLLAVGTNFVADLAGHQAEPIILGVGVFLLGACATFARFFPTIKQRYDYGCLIFILTYSFMAVSGYRDENLFEMAYQRLATILIGCFLCIIVSIVFFPIWAGEDLHKLLVSNMKGLGSSLEGCVGLYFNEGSHDQIEKASKGYKCVLNSKATEESLANFAKWEPAHGKFRFRYPWQQYVKIGARMRYCAYCVEALNGCLNSEIQTPRFLREHLKASCMNIATESCRILSSLADSVSTMTKCQDIDKMISNLNTAAQELQEALTSQPDLFVGSKSRRYEEKKNSMLVEAPKVRNHNAELSLNPTIISTQQGVAFMDTLPLATVACLLTEIVARLESVITEVDELGNSVPFKTKTAMKAKVDMKLEAIEDFVIDVNTDSQENTHSPIVADDGVPSTTMHAINTTNTPVMMVMDKDKDKDRDVNLHP